jgi:hypothetical protein
LRDDAAISILDFSNITKLKFNLTRLINSHDDERGVFDCRLDKKMRKIHIFHSSIIFEE